jgi:hypothetical protein
MGPLRQHRPSDAELGTPADGERCSPGHGASAADAASTPGEADAAKSRYTTGSRTGDRDRSRSRSRRGARNSDSAAYEGRGPRLTASQPPEPDLWTTALPLCEAFDVLGVASPLTRAAECHSDPGRYRGRFLSAGSPQHNPSPPGPPSTHRASARDDADSRPRGSDFYGFR